VMKICLHGDQNSHCAARNALRCERWTFFLETSLVKLFWMPNIGGQLCIKTLCDIVSLVMIIGALKIW
jgi:hypothetical protein